MIQFIGFSLIEIFITLLLIGILTAVMLPSQKSFFQSSNAKMSGEQLLQALQVARSEAILHNKIVTLAKEREWNNGYMIKMDNKILYTFRSSEGIIHWRAFPRASADLEFLPNGLTKVENGTFWFCNKNLPHPAWAIVINQGGRARMVLPNHNGKIIDGAREPIEC